MLRDRPATTYPGLKLARALTKEFAGEFLHAKYILLQASGPKL